MTHRWRTALRLLASIGEAPSGAHAGSRRRSIRAIRRELATRACLDVDDIEPVGIVGEGQPLGCRATMRAAGRARGRTAPCRPRIADEPSALATMSDTGRRPGLRHRESPRRRTGSRPARRTIAVTPRKGSSSVRRPEPSGFIMTMTPSTSTAMRPLAAATEWRRQRPLVEELAAHVQDAREEGEEEQDGEDGGARIGRSRGRARGKAGSASEAPRGGRASADAAASHGFGRRSPGAMWSGARVGATASIHRVRSRSRSWVAFMLVVRG